MGNEINGKILIWGIWLTDSIMEHKKTEDVNFVMSRLDKAINLFEEYGGGVIRDDKDLANSLKILAEMNSQKVYYFDFLSHAKDCTVCGKNAKMIESVKIILTKLELLTSKLEKIMNEYREKTQLDKSNPWRNVSLKGL